MIRVLVADDHDVIRHGLQLLIEAEHDLRCVGLAKDGVEAVALALENHPDVIVIDLAMPRMDGIAATREILRSYPDGVKLVALTFKDDRATVRGAFAAGVSAYLCKGVAARRVIDAIRSVHRGDVPEESLVPS